MHMPRNYLNNETLNQNQFWSYCLAIVSTLLIADAIAGDFIKLPVLNNQLEYNVSLFIMIATIGVYALRAPPGAKLERQYARHKL
jgi:hypothetical protein